MAHRVPRRAADQVPGCDDARRPVRLASARGLERGERHRRPGDRPERGLRNEKGNPGAWREPVGRKARGTDRDPANRGRVEHHRSIGIASARRGGSRGGEDPVKEDTALAHWSNAVEGLESAEILHNHGKYKRAVAEAYYAIEAAARDHSRARPTLAILDAGGMNDVLRSKPMLVMVRLGAALIGSFGLLGLLLAAVGLYGVVSHAVARRKQEFGIRSALGATSVAIIRLALGRGVVLSTRTGARRARSVRPSPTHREFSRRGQAGRPGGVRRRGLPAGRCRFACMSGAVTARGEGRPARDAASRVGGGTPSILARQVRVSVSLRGSQARVPSTRRVSGRGRRASTARSTRGS